MDIFKFVALLADLLAFSWFGLGKESYLGSTINFFIYDTIKIGILLIVINYFMAITRYHFPMEKVHDLLTKRRLFRLDYLFATALGIITLFCSCSSIPSFIGFIEVGILLGVTFAFLISSPLVNKFSLYLFPTMFEMKVTMLYNVVGINISILGGMLVHKLKIEKYVKPNLLKLKARNEVEEERGEVKLSFKKLVKYFGETVGL